MNLSRVKNWLQKLGSNHSNNDDTPEDLEQAVALLCELSRDFDSVGMPLPVNTIWERWMRNHWGLWSGGPLARWFYKHGIWHADDMSGLILKKYHSDIDGLEFDLQKEISQYLNHWEKAGFDNRFELKKKIQESLNSSNS